MDTIICDCDLDATCSEHLSAPVAWADALGIRPNPIDAWDAYEGGYKGRYFEGWA